MAQAPDKLLIEVEVVGPKIEPGRCYFAKRVGWHWEVWFHHSDGSADPASGATEWKAVTTWFWRWATAARIANETWSAFNDGVWVANCRHWDLMNYDHGNPYRHGCDPSLMDRAPCDCRYPGSLGGDCDGSCICPESGK